MARSRRPKPGTKDFNEGIYHRPPLGLSFFKTGVLAAIVILILSYLAYTKELPWSSEGYTATATFSNATTLRETSPVRIAGVNVGKVTSVEPDGENAKVTFTVDPEGLPLHDDATITIRPRLFLGGNYFLDLRPGSPSAPDLPDGGSIPVTRTATAVELDQVLTGLQRPARKDLGDLLDGYGSALVDKPTAKNNIGMDPDVVGLSGAEAINKTFDYGGRAGKTSSQVSEALLGEQAGDLRGLIKASGSVFQQLASRESQLSDLITNFSITTGAFAAEATSLQDTLAQLAPTLEQAQDQLPEINATFPVLRAYARELTPSVKELPSTIRAGTPWLRQADKLMQKNELAGIVGDLHKATPTLSAGTSNLSGLLRQLGQLQPLPDATSSSRPATSSSTTSSRPDSRTSASSSTARRRRRARARNFDGNGQFLRVQPGGGPFEVASADPRWRSPPQRQRQLRTIDRRPDRHPAAEARRRRRRSGPTCLLHRTTRRT